MSNTTATGAHAESIAESYLQQHGLTTLQKNFSCRLGELDLVMQDGDELVFIEVRFRSNMQYGGPIASIDSKKRKKLWAAAETYVQKNPHFQGCNQRFDVVGITNDKKQNKHSIEWLQNAITDY